MSIHGNSVTLIGMPGSGKSTLGVHLAKGLGLNFVDTDILLQAKLGSTLQQYLDSQGYAALRHEEEKIIVETNFLNHVVSTGGSAVYSDSAMKYLAGVGQVIYLKISFETLKARVNNVSQRGLASPAGQSLDDIYQERTALYEKYASHTVDNNIADPKQGLEKLLRVLADKP